MSTDDGETPEAAGYLPWPFVVLLVFLHGTLWPFLINAHHELVHKTVFRTSWLNTSFLYAICFLHWLHPAFFYRSHMRHHQYTLHYPDDKEVIAPIGFTWGGFFRTAFFNPMAIYHVLRDTTRIAFGMTTNDWMAELFPAEDAEGRRKLVTWARVLLAGHAAILAASIAMGWWMVPVVITFAFSYGGWLQALCNHTQHLGLPDRTPDYRACCRTVHLNPVLRFLYWHMNYHTEHHMYAAVPCYRLGRLHKLIRDDLPPTPRGLVAAWRDIARSGDEEARRLAGRV